MACRKVTVPFCRHQLAIYDCMRCSAGIGKQDPASYQTAFTGQDVTHVKRKHGKDIVYCGSQFEAPKSLNHNSRREDLWEGSQIMPTERRHPTLPSIQTTSTRDSKSRGSSSRAVSLQAQQQRFTPARHNLPLPNPQHPALTSLSFPNHSQSSNSPGARINHPSPATHSYQLDRFLNEVSDFRSAAYSKNEVPFHEPKTKRTEKSRKNYHALRVSIGSLQGRIEG